MWLRNEITMVRCAKLPPYAIALLENHPNHPVTKGIVQNIINNAKANATDEELEEIKRLENQAFEF